MINANIRFYKDNHEIHTSIQTVKGACDNARVFDCAKLSYSILGIDKFII